MYYMSRTEPQGLPFWVWEREQGRFNPLRERTSQMDVKSTFFNKICAGAFLYRDDNNGNSKVKHVDVTTLSIVLVSSISILCRRVFFWPFLPTSPALILVLPLRS